MAIHSDETGKLRRRLLINPRFQTVFALYALSTTLFMVPFFIAANYYFFDLFAKKAQSLGYGPEHELVKFVESQQVLLVVAFIVVTMIVLSVNLVISYIISNRIAGSLYRLTYIINQTTDLATAEKAHPRSKYDFFNDLLIAYNNMIDRLR